ncbi:hypothetical protein JRO89_XS02G0228900 [Xanthoceras sorbifolium]|uniref:RNase H type-1 domain-containing protein n=1 Tax=Xanthoceras sorbifolium TaxID=99658 RepID=A0ABQ8II36_9ROSI|nr:hypothetical protein JRO89_XS02G0228900 [Xanthoceras sorbifolium]
MECVIVLMMKLEQRLWRVLLLNQGKKGSSVISEAKAARDGILVTGVEKELSRKSEIDGDSGNFVRMGGTKKVGFTQQLVSGEERGRSLIDESPNVLLDPKIQVINSVGPILGADGPVIPKLGKGVLVIDSGLGSEDRVTMEGIELDCEDLADRPNRVSEELSEDLKLQKVRKWKRAARAWSKTQVLGKVSSPIQKMLRATQKLSKSPKRKTSPGIKSPGNSVKSVSGDGDDGVLKGEIEVGKGGKRKGNFIAVEDIFEAKKRKDDGLILSSEADIAKEICKYFANIFKSSSPCVDDLDKAVRSIEFSLSMKSKLGLDEVLYDLLIQFKGLEVLDILGGVSGLINREQLAWVCVLMWCVWWNRNLAVHGGFVRDVVALSGWAADFFKEFQHSQLNSDVAVRVDSGLVGVGAVIRGVSGDIVAAVSKKFPGFFSAEVGELIALREGLLLVKSLGLKICVAEVDASNVASMVNEAGSSLGDASFIVEEIKVLCSEVGDCRCLSVPRSGNRLAHVLASSAFSSNGDQSWSFVSKNCFPVV